MDAATECDLARRALDLALEGAPEPVEVLRHVKLCADCAAHARQLDQLDACLHQGLGPLLEAPTGLAERVLARLPDQSPVELRERGRQRLLGEGLALTAGLLVLAWGLEQLLGAGIAPPDSALMETAQQGLTAWLEPTTSWLAGLTSWSYEFSADGSFSLLGVEVALALLAAGALQGLAEGRIQGGARA